MTGTFPLGAILALAFDYRSDKVPPGWAPCDGNLYSTDTYPELFRVMKETYGSQGSQDALPDYRGYFLRGTNHGMGPGAADAAGRTASRPTLDHGGVTGDVVGSLQASALRTHEHSFAFRHGSGKYASHGGSGSIQVASESTSTSNPNNSETESRPRNVAVVFVIRAY